MRAAQFFRVSCYPFGGDQDAGFDAAVRENVDEVADCLAVDGPGPVLAFDYYYGRQHGQSIRQAGIADTDVNLLGAKEADYVTFSETARHALEEIHRQRFIRFPLRIGSGSGGLPTPVAPNP